ncbi:MAG: thioredoxin family protein [Verrucomicrobiae bacterium]|nr:thioredoxin family protein [Verrucomicrobiae bacterium]
MKVSRMLPLAFAAGTLFAVSLIAQEAPAPSAVQTPESAKTPDAAPAMPDLKNAPEKPEAPHQSWFTDYQSAHKKAVEEHKHLLLVFTGSDWIPLCRIYDRDILNQPEFIDVVSEKFVPVRLDFPKETKLPANQAKQNQLLLRAYRVTAFPTVFLTDTEGRPYGVNGYQPVTPANYAQIINAMRQMAEVRDQYFEKAAAAEGLEKAKLLVKGVPNLPGNLSARYYRKQLDEIIANDPKDETGKVAKCKRLIADVAYSDQMQGLEEKVEWGKMLEVTDAYIRDNGLQGVERQQALMNKVGVYRKQSNLTEMVRTLLEIVSVDEKSPIARQAQALLDKLRAQKLQEDLSPRR